MKKQSKQPTSRLLQMLAEYGTNEKGDIYTSQKRTRQRQTTLGKRKKKQQSQERSSDGKWDYGECEHKQQHQHKPHTWTCYPTNFDWERQMALEENIKSLPESRDKERGHLDGLQKSNTYDANQELGDFSQHSEWASQWNR